MNKQALPKTSHHAVYCQNSLVHPPKAKEPAVTMRNYIMFLVSLQNANRAGLLTNMAVSDLKDCEKLTDKRVIHIASHKTVTAYRGK